MDTSNNISFSKENFLLMDVQIDARDIPYKVWQKLFRRVFDTLQKQFEHLPCITTGTTAPLKNLDAWGEKFFLNASPGRQPHIADKRLLNARLYPMCALGTREMCPPPEVPLAGKGFEDYVLYYPANEEGVAPLGVSHDDFLPNYFVRLRRNFDYYDYGSGNESISVKNHEFSLMSTGEIEEVMRSSWNCCKILASLRQLLQKSIETKRWYLKSLEDKHSIVIELQRKIVGFEG